MNSISCRIPAFRPILHNAKPSETDLNMITYANGNIIKHKTITGDHNAAYTI